MPDLYTAKLWNDGEALTHADLNESEMFALARLADQLYARLVGTLAAVKDPDIGGEGGADPALTSLIYTLTGGDAVLKQGSTATRVSTLGGTIFQRVAVADGETPQFLPYTLAPDEFDLVIGAGDATNPRVDIVQVKLELVSGGSESRDFKDAVTGALSSQAVNKTRRVSATISLKAGTPGATPTYPTPDAGYAVLGAVYVPATWATGIVADGTGSASAGLRQCSVPLRIEAVRSLARDWFSSDADWTYNTSTGAFNSSGGGAANNLFCYAPGGHGQRIVGVAVIGTWQGSCSAIMRRAPRTILGPDNVAVPANDLSASLVNNDGTMRHYFAHMGVIADASSDSNPSAANGPIGDPFWACGGKGGPTHRLIDVGGAAVASGGHRTALVLSAGIGGVTQIMEIIWYLAG